MSVKPTAPIAPFIRPQFPSYLRDSESLLVDVTEAYYEWKQNAGNSVGTLLSKFEGITDIEQSGLEFFEYFNTHYIAANSFDPETLENFQNISTLIELAYTEQRLFMVVRLLPLFYRSRGTEDAIRFLFRLIYQDTPEIYYPGDSIIKFSGGKWNQKVILRTASAITGSLSSDATEAVKIWQAATNSFATIENVAPRRIEGIEFYEIEISGIKGGFELGSTIKSVDDEIGLEFDPLPQVLRIDIDDAGSGYETGDGLVFNDTYSGLAASVKTVHIPESETPGAIKGINILESGIVYDTENPPIADLSGSGDGNATATVVIGAQFKTAGSYATKQSLLDSATGITQGGNKFHPYSYVIRSGIEFERYKEAVKSLAHPVGVFLFGEINFVSSPNTGSGIVALDSRNRINIVAEYENYIEQQAIIWYESVPIGDINSFIDVETISMQDPYIVGETITNERNGATAEVSWFDSRIRRFYLKQSSIVGDFKVGDTVVGTRNPDDKGKISTVLLESGSSSIGMWEKGIVPSATSTYVSIS